MKYPGLNINGGLALAIAIGIGAGSYDLVGKLMWPTIPLPDGDRIVSIETHNAVTNQPELRVARDFLEWRSDVRSIDGLGAYRAGVWQRSFEGRDDVVGSTVRLGSTPVTVVGVMPKEFGYPVSYHAWTPLQLRASYGALEGDPDIVHQPRGSSRRSTARSSPDTASMAARSVPLPERSSSMKRSCVASCNAGSRRRSAPACGIPTNPACQPRSRRSKSSAWCGISAWTQASRATRLRMCFTPRRPPRCLRSS